ncbi:hypothetical protein P170DRAFT_427922 [Aspergillus steynii IBT 23096]|uniref:F-box domain-containing protein n=1 Tax=Aspergillus steynii IBT 23096 TaxID=1392250 RepID=A0A2I2G191_9EURO|nr:uncharacterized protein P170DRAFT_427922 [Aspergillus steynii IBT 23096]PLB46616.1 hypothetical protein P170DRAFT_427922 [Aspergillus steynii IBT 23096]
MQGPNPSQGVDGVGLTNEEPASDYQSLQSLPTEILIDIYCKLESLFAVYQLAATCARLQSIWLENTNAIYNSIGPVEIKCHRHARNLLTDQGGPSPNSLVSVSDVRRLTRNMRIVHGAIDFYDKIITSRIGGNRYFGYYGSDPRPAQLTYTERRRFIRAYYQILGSIMLEPERQNDRLHSIPLKDLMIMEDITWLWYTEGCRTGGGALAGLSGEQKQDLVYRIDEAAAYVYKRVYNNRYNYIRFNLAPNFGTRGHYCVFDHAQRDVMDEVRGLNSPPWPKPNPLCPPEWAVDTDDDS